MRRLILFTSALLFSAGLLAQNPVIRDQYTADPTARVFGGKVWLFPSPASIKATGLQNLKIGLEEGQNLQIDWISFDSSYQQRYSDSSTALEKYLLPASGAAASPDKDGAKVKKLRWHAMDSQLFNVKLFRFATNLTQERYGVLFWAATVINCEEEIPGVRLAVGSNSASMWWVNGEEALLLSGDRRMVMDDAASGLLTLHKGRNVIWGAVINGPGMSDFCLRFIDQAGNPVTNFTVSTK